jgi:hypothetical protein
MLLSFGRCSGYAATHLCLRQRICVSGNASASPATHLRRSLLVLQVSHRSCTNAGVPAVLLVLTNRHNASRLSSVARRRHSTLRDLAEACGHSPASLASAVGVDETTIYRHWVEEDWPNHIRADVIRKLMAVVPGVETEYSRSVVDERIEQLLTEATRAGVEVNRLPLIGAMQHHKIVPQFLCSALEAAISIMKEDQDRAIRSLRSCWGREQTRALDAVYGTSEEVPALLEPEPLLSASRAMFDTLQRSRINYQRAIALGHLAHHLGKSSVEGPDIISSARRPSGLHDQMAGFFARGGYTGMMRRRDDIDIARRYHWLVSNDGAARLIELWAFPSWTGDLVPSDGFSVPRGVSLTNTAKEVIYEIGSYNDAYVSYLANTYVPLALEQMDETFGHQLNALKEAVERRLDKTSMIETRTALSGLLEQLRSN